MLAEATCVQGRLLVLQGSRLARSHWAMWMGIVGLIIVVGNNCADNAISLNRDLTTGR
jgi:hypothetical protein